tara:strand:- start:4 stop:270 length:267 start_codon:yes stop_codon:yes gene_type:complete
MNLDLKIKIPKRVTCNDIKPLINFKTLDSEFEITTSPHNTPNTPNTPNANEHINKKRKRDEYYTNVDESEKFCPYNTLEEFIKFYDDS